MKLFLDVPNENVSLCSSCQEKLGGELRDRYEKMIVAFFYLVFFIKPSLPQHTIVSLRDS